MSMHGAQRIRRNAHTTEYVGRAGSINNSLRIMSKEIFTAVQTACKK